MLSDEFDINYNIIQCLTYVFFLKGVGIVKNHICASQTGVHR